MKQLLVQETEQTYTLDCQQHVILVLRLDSRSDQGLANLYKILVVDISPALFEENKAEVKCAFEAEFFFEVKLLDQCYVVLYLDRKSVV